MPLNKASEASLVIIGKSGPVVQFLFRFTEYTNRDRHVNRSKYCQLKNTKISKPKHFLSNFQLPSSHKSKKNDKHDLAKTSRDQLCFSSIT